MKAVVKKRLAYLVCMAMVALSLGGFGGALTAAASGDPVFQEHFDYTHDFDSTVKKQTGQSAAGGNWAAKSTGSLGWNNQASFGVGADPADGDNSVLTIETAGAWNTPSHTTAVKSTQLQLDANKGYTIRFDIRRGDGEWTAGAGIRFMMDEQEQNYYELQFPGGNAYAANYKNNWVLASVRNGVAVNNWTVGGSNGETVGSYLGRSGEFAVLSGNTSYLLGLGRWYSMELSVNNGNLSWKVTERGSTARDSRFEGSATDTAPLSGASPLQFAFIGTGQGAQYSYFDNLVIHEEKSRIEYEDPRGGYTEVKGTLFIGPEDDITLRGVFNGSAAADASWSSSNERVVTVGETGRVTVKGFGTATVTAETQGGQTVSATISTLTPKPEKFTENFDGYSPYAADAANLDAGGLGAYIADGNWRAKLALTPDDGMGYAHGAKYGVSLPVYSDFSALASGDNKVLAIVPHATGAQRAFYPVVYSTQNMMNTAGAYEITAKMASSIWETGVGIRFMVHNWGQNYYELLFAGGGNGNVADGSWQLIKCVDNQIVDNWAVENESAIRRFASGKIAENNTTQFQGRNWYDLNLKVDNGAITFSFTSMTGEWWTKKQFNSIKVTDTAPFAPAEATMGFFSAGMYSSAGFFDEVTCQMTDPFLSGEEPASVLYGEISRNKPVPAADGENPGFANDGDPSSVYTGTGLVIDTGDSYVIRKITAEGLTGSARVLVSSNAADWLYLLDLNASGSVINSKTTSPFRYIKLEADETFSLCELRVFSDAAEYKVRLNAALYFAPRIGGVQVSDAQWIVSLPDYGAAASNAFIPAAVTAGVPVTLTASAAGGSIGSNVHVLEGKTVSYEGNTALVEMGYRFADAGTDILMALYRPNGRLMEVRGVSGGALNDNADFISFSVEIPADATRAVLFIWNGGFEGMEPVTSRFDVK